MKARAGDTFGLGETVDEWASGGCICGHAAGTGVREMGVPTLVPTSEVGAIACGQ